MSEVDSAVLIDLVKKFGQPRILVVGDVMLDRYIWGDATRISQEAPVLLLQADRREERLGGASSVATLLRALGAHVLLAGVVGSDQDGARLRGLIVEQGIDDEALLVDPSRPTTVKERYIGRAQHRHPQQMIRVDYEVRRCLDESLETQLGDLLLSQLRAADIVLISDYDKGVCTSGLLCRLIAAARSCNRKILADPIRGTDYRKYHGCSAITPNRLEAGLATGRTINTLDDAYAAGKELRERLDLEAAIITLDRDGMALIPEQGQPRHYPTRPRQVYDITGAGDMVMATLGMALASGAEYGPAIALANVAGGLEVEKIGVATVTREEILQDLLHGGRCGSLKVRTRSELVAEVERRRALGQRIAFTNGCFDVLHAGHVQYLAEARAQADVLIVGLNSDASVRQLKGPTRPINDQHSRSLVLAGLESVDYLTIFDELTPLELIRAIRPDVLVKGADYRPEQVVGADLVLAAGGRVHLAALRVGHSTTRLLEQLKVA
jgi:D-beta-D-heptose 7-phosphate kinase/D-beta-D-heptose 1-phosphate adenosyltransferase